MRAYDPKRSRDYKALVAIQIQSQRPRFIADGPIALYMVFHMPRPKKGKEGIHYHVIKPDLDNLTKSIKDAMSNLVWKDDSQVSMLHAEKIYTDGEPFTEITVERL